MVQNNDARVQVAEKRLFWWTLYLTQFAWGLFAVTALIKFYWSYLVCCNGFI